MDDVERLQLWLDGKYVSPPEFKESLKAVIENIGDMGEKHAEKDIVITDLVKEIVRYKKTLDKSKEIIHEAILSQYKNKLLHGCYELIDKTLKCS